MSPWLKLKLSGIEILRIPTDSLQCFQSLHIIRQTDPLLSTRAFFRSLNSSSGLYVDSYDSEGELLLSESSLLLLDEPFLFILCYYQIRRKSRFILNKFIHFFMANKKEEEIDPSIYQYDEVYDQIKGNKQKEQERSRSRSRQKQKKREDRPKQSKYIAKMKQIAEDRQKDHELAHQKVLRRQNERMGIEDEMVFVTQSYLKKKQQEKQIRQKKLQQQKNNAKNQVEKGSFVDFKKKMLDQTMNLQKK